MKIVTWSLPRPWLLQTYVSRLGRNGSQYLPSRACKPIQHVESGVRIKEVSYPFLSILVETAKLSQWSNIIKMVIYHWRPMSMQKPDEKLFKPKTLNLSSSVVIIKQPSCLFELWWIWMCVNRTYMLGINIVFCWTKVNIAFVSVKHTSEVGKKVEIHYFCSCRRHSAAVFILADNLDIRWQDRELQMHNIVQTLCTYSTFSGKHVILYFPWCH